MLFIEFRFFIAFVATAINASISISFDSATTAL